MKTTQIRPATRALLVAGLLALGTVTPVRAASILYVIQNNGGLQDTSGPAASIAGQFTYDTLTTAITDFEVTLTTTQAFGGTTTDAAPFLLSGFGRPLIEFYETATYPAPIGIVKTTVQFVFEDIGDVGPYSFFSGNAFSLVGLGVESSLVAADRQNPPSLVGTIQSAAEAPEPASLSLIGGALVLLGLVRRKRARRSRADGWATFRS